MARVCLLSNLYPPVNTGSSTHCSGLARELVQQGHDVVVVTARLRKDQPYVTKSEDGVTVYRLPALHLPRMGISLNFEWLNATCWPSNWRRIDRIIEQHGIELLHVHNHMFDMALNTMLAARRKKIPVVLTMHTVIHRDHRLYDMILAPLDKHFLGRCVVSGADAIISPDYNMNKYVRDRFGRQDGAVIPYGIDLPPKPLPEDVEALRREFGLDGKRVVLSLGHVHAIRNRLDLVRAWPAIVKAVPNAVLLVVGSVNDDAPVRLASELGVADSIIFAGARPRHEVPAFFALCDVEAHWLSQETTEWASPGIATMEAMCFGVPVITVGPDDVYGADVLQDGRNVVLVRRGEAEPLAERLIHLLNDEAARQAMALAARETAHQEFYWPRVAARTAELYQKLGASSAPPASDRHITPAAE